MALKNKSALSHVLAIVLIAIVLCGAIGGGVLYYYATNSANNNGNDNNNQTPTLPGMTLTLVAANGTQLVINQTDMAKLQSITSFGGLKSSGGSLGAIGNYTGIPVLTLLDLVGGLQAGQTISVTSADGYKMSYTNAQVHGQSFATYNNLTGVEQTAAKAITMIASYYYNGQALTSYVTSGYGADGPIRLALVGSECLLTEGHFWAKMVTKIEIGSGIKDWTVRVNATSAVDNSTLMSDTMTMQDFQPDLMHFGLNYTDTQGNIWTGTALWRWVAWANYNHPTQVTNASLDNGYFVRVWSGDGTFVTFNDTEVKLNNNIIVASLLNGEVLSVPQYPLRMVGASVNSTRTISNIVQIQIVLLNPITEWTVTVNGTNTITLSLTQFETIAASNPLSYTSSSDVWSGTSLYQVINWAVNQGAIDASYLTNGYTVKVIGSDGVNATFSSERLINNNDMIVAYKVNGEYIASNDPKGNYPISLKGANFTSGSEKIKAIATIQILPNMTLTIVAANGTEYTVGAQQLFALQTYTYSGGLKNSANNIVNVGNYTGINILDLLIQYGFIEGQSAKVCSTDNKNTTYTCANLHGQDIAAYDANKNSVTPTQPLVMLVSYAINGTRMGSDVGPFRIITLGPEGYFTSGSMSARNVYRIEIIAA